MSIGQAFIEALDSLFANKMRSGLTVLGIIIGVAAVIAMLAIGAGAQDTITGQISGLGSNLLFVFSGNMSEDVRNPQPLTVYDAEAIADPLQAPSVAGVAPVIQSNASASYGGQTVNTQVDGVTSDFLSIRNYELSEGENFSSDDLLGQKSVAILAADVAKNLFDRTDGVVGESIRVKGQPFRVIGVLASKGGSSFGSQDNFILVPFDTAQNRLVGGNRNEVDVIYIQATTADSVTSAVDEISQILRSRHRINLTADDFTVFTQQDFVSTAQTITGVLTVFLGGIAAISLLVGGIGIMNIMLVSVTERTREIGLRKAIGARKRDILIQFLTESSLLSLFGGILGIVLGWLIAFIVGQVATSLGTPFNPQVGIDAILLATIFSTAVGLFFGLYPANRAANLEPVEALRHD
jgi:putative ABC transport system permease protein